MRGSDLSLGGAIGGAPAATIAALRGARAENRSIRLGFAGAVAVFAALAYSPVWALAWLGVQLGLNLPEARVWARINRAAETGAVWALPLACAFVAAQSGGFASIALLAWLEGGPYGALTAGMFLAAATVNASLTLRAHAPAIASAVAPNLAIMGAAPFVEAWVHIGDPLGFDPMVLVPVAFLGLFTAAIGRQIVDFERREVAARAEIEAARRVAEETNAARQRFLKRMARHLRTPMNAMYSCSALVRRTEAAPTARARLDALADAGDVLMAAVSDLLDMASIESGSVRIVPCAVDPRLLALSAVEAWRPRAEQKWLELFVDVDDTVPHQVLLDPVRVKQVLFNLLANAIHNTANGGVRMRLEADPTAQGHVGLRFSVIDTGPGIAATRLAALFSEGEAGRGAAQGLGLPMSARLARLMGGDIAVQTAPGAGARFTFTVPAAVWIEEAAPEEKAPRANLEGGAMRVLVADDHAVARRVAAAVLAEVGAVVIQASEGRSALELVMREPFDLILLDLQMPELSGLEVARAMRAASGPNRGAPIIALTAAALGEDRRRCFEAGMDGHVPKPLDPVRLLEEVARLTGGADAVKAA